MDERTLNHLFEVLLNYTNPLMNHLFLGLRRGNMTFNYNFVNWPPSLELMLEINL